MTMSAAPPPEAAAPRVLIVDDEPALRRGLSRLLSTREMEVLTAGDGLEALSLIARERVDVALVDLRMPKLGGLELLERVRREHPHVQVVMMTAHGDVDTAVTAVRSGAFHFLTKPFRSDDEVVLAVGKAAEHGRLLGRTRELQRRLARIERFGQLIGNSPPMREVYRLAVGVAATEATVLILGESGTGKELTARAIHQHSRRAEGPFVALNCAAIPPDLIESELFGHVRGAFTGATAARAGLFEAGNGGTLFLDEVGELPTAAQVRLLRALQEGEIRPVGDSHGRHVDVRVIAATNVDLRSRVTTGAFREDLFYRLHVVTLELPPLRERREDIPLLAQHFLEKHASRSGRAIERIAPTALERLMRHEWPGNVRELENAIEHAVVFCRTEALAVEDLPLDRSVGDGASRGVALAEGYLELPFTEAKQRALAAFEASYIAHALTRAGGNVSEAARAAQLDRSNFRRAAKRAGVLSATERRSGRGGRNG